MARVAVADRGAEEVDQPVGRSFTRLDEKPRKDRQEFGEETIIIRAESLERSRNRDIAEAAGEAVQELMMFIDTGEDEDEEDDDEES